MSFPKREEKEIFVDSDEDTMYVTDAMMEKLTSARTEETNQQQIFTIEQEEPQNDDVIIGQYQKYLYFN